MKEKRESYAELARKLDLLYSEGASPEAIKELREKMDSLKGEVKLISYTYLDHFDQPSTMDLNEVLSMLAGKERTEKSTNSTEEEESQE